MKKLLLIFACIFALQLSAQTSSLEFSLNLPSSESGYTLYLMRESDTVRKIDFYESDLIELDSLEDGNYRVYIYDESTPGEYIIKRFFTLQQDVKTVVSLDLYYDEEIKEPEYGMVQKTELQLSLGYFHSPWADKNSITKDNFSASYSGHYWGAFSKHAGFLLGSGFSFSQHYFDRDTSLFQAIPFKKVFERYTAINMMYEVKFRFSSGDQKSEDFNSSKFFVDIGAGYYLPLLFNHSAMYRGSKKVIERNIHQFKDFRAFVNIGFAPVTVFLEYRLSDYIRKDYPELPKYNVGIKLMLPG